MNIVFPIAGKGARFVEAGYTELKPFIKLKGKYIIEWAISSLGLKGKYWFVGNQLTEEQQAILKSIADKYCESWEYYNTQGETKGAADTVLRIASFISWNEPLIITNCDQWTPWNAQKFQDFLDKTDFDGIVTTYNHPGVVVGQSSKYSHIRLNDEGVGVELAEKVAISYNSLNGIHWFKEAGMFFYAATCLSEAQSINEKYVSLAYNFLIQKGYKIGVYHMEDHEFVSLGTPEEVNLNQEKLC
jgi:NDP-sugar pyrophosphorylase family protein